MQKKYKISLIVIICLIIIVSAFGVFKFLNNKKPPVIENKTNIISNIDKYGYTLDDRDTKYMQQEFNNLKAILEEPEIDYDAYASSIAKLFIIDFYTLNNKINKYDVGSLEYIYEPKKNDFNLLAMSTLYNNIIDNTYKDRVQDLPEITNVEILSLEQTSFTLNNEEVTGYKITMNYTYKENLGYDTEGTIYLIENANKLEVAIYNPSIEENS